MAGPSIGYATLQVIPSMKGVGASMASQVKGPAAAAGSTAGTIMGTAMKGAMAGALVGIGAIAGLAKLGGSFDDAFDTIRVGTGATGDALEGLQGSFKSVFGSVPTDMTSASTAIADLNTRLGLTGEPLENLATQMLELSRITGSDLGSNIESVTRVFGDWGIAAEDQAGSLDALFRASQATGIATDTLGQQMVKYGAPLRQLGFDFETTAGLLGKFEKEGVNAELVMGSMRIALGQMARDGEPAEETLQRVTEQIANAGSASEANALALEVFGARAGPDMAAAIREGRFELGDLYDQISDGSETILGAAEDTNDWKESWERLRNQGFVLLEPIATRVFEVLGTGMDYLAEKAPIVAAWFGENMWPGIKTVGEFIGGAVTTGFALLSSWWADHGDTVTGGLKTIGEVIGSAVSAGFQALSNWWDTNGDTVLGGIRGIGDVINDPVIPAFEAMVDWIKDEVLPRLGDIMTWVATSEPILATFAGTTLVLVAGKFAALAVAAHAAAVGMWAALAPVLVALLPVILVGAAIGIMAALFYKAYKNADQFGEDLEEIVGWLKDLWDWLWKAGRRLDEFADKARNALGDAIGTDPVITGYGPSLGDIAEWLGISGFDTGGIVPGAVGSPQLILAHGGETVLPTHKQDFDALQVGGRSGTTIVNNWNGADVDERSAVAIMAWELA